MFACIYISDFPVQALVRAEPLLRERAVAVLEGKPPLTRVVALNKKARMLGMEMNMTKLQASVFAAPEEKSPAILRQRSPEQETSAHSALLDVAHAFTPRVEDTASDTLLLDLAGLERLYGAPAKIRWTQRTPVLSGTPRKMARDLAARVSFMGLEANIALAANPDAAMHAAIGFSGVTVIPPGKEEQRLGRLPLSVLLGAFEIFPEKNPVAGREELREQMLDTLERWGVRDFRALARLPEQALASRLGEVGARLQRLARGAGMRTLSLCGPPLHFEEAMELESPVEMLEPLSFILNRLLEQLCARLESRALAAQELHLRLQLEREAADEDTRSVSGTNDNSHNVGWKILERTLRLPVAMRETKVFLKLLQLELAAHPPSAPVGKVWIAAEPASPRTAQRGLFLPIFPEAERLEITLARIRGIVGVWRAGIARLLDSHRPGDFRMERFVVAPESKPTKHFAMLDMGEQPRLALRRLRPVQRLQVRLFKGRPVRLTAVAEQTYPTELQGNALWSAGPWRSSGNWWAENSNSAESSSGPFDREEWDVALAQENGTSVALYRIYRDLMSGQWFADASYD